MDVYRIGLFIVINILATSNGTVIVSDPSGRNAVTVQETLTLTCLVHPLTTYVFWHTPAAAGGTICYCSITNDSCSPGSTNDDRVSCTSDVSKGLFTLTISNMSIIDEGIYSCRHNLTKPSLNIYVQVPITSVEVIRPSTSPVTASENSPMTFVCVTSAGRPQATIQWYKQIGTNAAVAIHGGITSTTNIGPSVITTSTLQYTPARLDHNYRFFCTAFNIDAAALHTSNNKPQLKVPYASDTGPFLEGQTNGTIFYTRTSRSQSLTCSLEGWPLPSLDWNCFHGDVIDVSTETISKQQITWTALLAHDGQRCSCQVSHETFAISRDVYVTIDALYPPTSPTITVQSRPVSGAVSVIEGKDLLVICSSTGNPPPVYAWNPRGASSTDAILELTNVSVSDDGEYTCTATNTMKPTQGDNESASRVTSLKINVLYAPKHLKTTDPDETIVIYKTLYDNLILSLSVMAYPPPNFTWYVASKCNSSEWTNITTGVSADSNKSTLTIGRINQSQFGVYKLQVFNGISPDLVQRFTVKEIDNQPQGLDNQCTDLNASVATGTGVAGLLCGIALTVLTLYLLQYLNMLTIKRPDVNAENTSPSKSQSRNNCTESSGMSSTVHREEEMHTYDDLADRNIKANTYESLNAGSSPVAMTDEQQENNYVNVVV